MRFPLAVEADDLHIRGKLLHKLAAHAAGIAVIVAASGDDDADKVGVALADGLAHGGALGAGAHGVHGVFNVAAGEYRAVGSIPAAAPTGKWE